MLHTSASNHATALVQSLEKLNSRIVKLSKFLEADILRVTLPNIFQAILAALLLSFKLSFDDVVISEFLSGPSVNSLPQVIFGYVRRGINPTIYAAAALLIATVTVVIMGYSVWVARQTRERDMAAGARA